MPQGALYYEEQIIKIYLAVKTNKSTIQNAPVLLLKRISLKKKSKVK